MSCDRTRCGSSEFFEHVGIDDSATVQGKSHVQEIKEPKNENQLPAIKGSFGGHI
jgi:hypothetical protein